MNPKIHKGFADSHEAYDASQTDDSIHNGDILVCDDGDVAILAKAWPIAIIEINGSAFHHMPHVHTWKTFDKGSYYQSYLLAKKYITKIQLDKPILVVYESIDHYRESKKFSHIGEARAWAREWVGTYPTICDNGGYAISDDGIGKITCYGCNIEDLFGGR